MNECPKCKHDLNIAIERYFWNEILGSYNANEFEYSCPNCSTIVNVEVDSCPVFTVRKIEEQQ